jgi:hypothetical protein
MSGSTLSHDRALRHIANIPLDKDGRIRSILPVHSSGHPYPQLWCFQKTGSIAIYDGLYGDQVFLFGSRSSIPRCGVEIRRYAEVWVGHCDGLIRVFRSSDPYDFVEDIFPANSCLGGVHCLAIDGTGGTVFAGLGDNSIVVFGVDSKQLTRRLVGHSRAVRSLVSNGDLLFSGSDDGQVLCWDAKVGAVTCHPRETSLPSPVFDSPVTALAVSKGGQLLWCGSEEGVLRIFKRSLDAADADVFEEGDEADENGAIEFEAFAKHRVRTPPLCSISIIEGSALISSADEYLLQIDANTGALQGQATRLSTLSTPALPQLPKKDGIHGISVAAEHTTAAVSAGRLSLVVLCLAQGNGTTQLLRQESVGGPSLEELISVRRSGLSQQLLQLKRDLALHRERLEVRVNPPRDDELEAALDDVKKIETSLVKRTRALTRKLIVRQEEPIRRRVFIQWWAHTLQRRLRRREVRADRLVSQSMAKHVEQRWMPWKASATKVTEAHQRVEALSELERKNASIVLRRFYDVLARYAQHRGLLGTVMNLEDRENARLRRQYLQKWRKALKNSSALRRKKSMAGCMLSMTDNGRRRVVWEKLVRFLRVRREARAKNLVAFSLATNNQRAVLRYRFAAWVRAARSARIHRRDRQMKLLALGGLSSVLSHNYYRKWIRLITKRKRNKLNLRLLSVYSRETTVGLLRGYYFLWKQSVVLRKLREPTSPTSRDRSKRMKQFVYIVSPDGLLRQYFRKWIARHDESSLEVRKIKAIEVLLQSTVSGTLRLSYIRWLHFMQHRRTERSKRNIKGAFLRNFSIGLQSIYFRKWHQYAAWLRGKKRRAEVARVMSGFVEMVHRSRYFQTWLNKVLTKRRLMQQFQLMTVPPDDCRRRYFFKWIGFLAAPATRARHIAEQQQAGKGAEEERLAQKLEEVQRSLATDQFELQQLEEDRAAAERVMYRNHSAALWKDDRLKDEKETFAKQEEKLNKLRDRLAQLRNALNHRRGRPPVAAAAEWFNDWMSVERRVHQLLVLTGADTPALSEADLERELQEIAKKCVSAHKTLSSDFDRFSIHPSEKPSAPPAQSVGAAGTPVSLNMHTPGQSTMTPRHLSPITPRSTGRSPGNPTAR